MKHPRIVATNIIHNTMSNIYETHLFEKTIDEIITICSICCDNYENDDECIITKCNHIYHKKCIDVWLNKNNTCPICRQIINQGAQFVLVDNMHEQQYAGIDDIQRLRDFYRHERDAWVRYVINNDRYSMMSYPSNRSLEYDGDEMALFLQHSNQES